MMARKKLYYRDVRMAPYDLVKEFLVAMAVVTVLVLVLSLFLSSPDVPPVTIQGVAQSSPQTYVQTSLNSLDGTSPVAGYGPPYNTGTGSVQTIGPLSFQKLAGVRIPVDTAQAFVLGPIAQAAATNPTLKTQLAQFNAAGSKQQAAWEDAYGKALAKATERPPTLTVPACSCGPVAPMMATLLKMGQSGAMDGLLLTSGHFYQTDYTRPLLFMQNDAVAAKAANFNLLGSTWGVTNETGNYPGQAWLWLYTMLYQIPPYTTAWAANTDALAILTVSILTLILMVLPWIPGLNRLPRYLKVYRLIWKDYYREQRDAAAPVPPASEPTKRPVGV
ncbi:MAG: hypothetical protein NVS2B16_11790 [Chloroflexota bacterium]